MNGSSRGWTAQDAGGGPGHFEQVALSFQCRFQAGSRPAENGLDGMREMQAMVSGPPASAGLTIQQLTDLARSQAKRLPDRRPWGSDAAAKQVLISIAVM